MIELSLIEGKKKQIECFDSELSARKFIIERERHNEIWGQTHLWESSKDIQKIIGDFK